MFRWEIEIESERLCSSQYSAFSPSIRVKHLFWIILLCPFLFRSSFFS